MEKSLTRQRVFLEVEARSSVSGTDGPGELQGRHRETSDVSECWINNITDADQTDEVEFSHSASPS